MLVAELEPLHLLRVARDRIGIDPQDVVAGEEPARVARLHVDAPRDVARVERLDEPVAGDKPVAKREVELVVHVPAEQRGMILELGDRPPDPLRLLLLAAHLAERPARAVIDVRVVEHLQPARGAQIHLASVGERVGHERVERTGRDKVEVRDGERIPRLGVEPERKERLAVDKQAVMLVNDGGVGPRRFRDGRIDTRFNRDVIEIEPSGDGEVNRKT